jgi:hypothetical protein
MARLAEPVDSYVVAVTLARLALAAGADAVAAVVAPAPSNSKASRVRWSSVNGGASAMTAAKPLQARDVVLWPSRRAAFAAIRKPVSHDELDELPEHEALEQLASLSVLARWVDNSTVLR